MAMLIGTLETNPETIDHPVLSVVLEYWREKKAGRSMPSRGDIRPKEIVPFLPSLVLADVLVGERDFRYRLIGTLVTSYFGKNYTGQKVSDAFASWPPAVGKAAIQMHETCARDRAVLYVSVPEGWHGELEPFSSLYLPLSTDGQACDTILNAFVFNRDAVILARKLFSAAVS